VRVHETGSSPDLKHRLEKIGRAKTVGRKLVLRTADSFPGKRTKGDAALEQLKAKGFSKVEMDDKELMLLHRLHLLDRVASKSQFEGFVSDQILSLPSVRLLLGA
jgi:hypothetical protein